MPRIQKAAHFTAGLLTALSVEVHPVLVVISYLAFVGYEGVEKLTIKDEMFRELLEYALGFYSGVVLLLALRLL